MKRMDSSESLGGMVSVPKSADEKPSLCNNINDVYKRGFQSFLEGMEEEDSMEESGQICEKKRRLGAEQVKALEKNFEVENKLEPERKIKLAQELGLQPRQVAVWFQNRRARWKTKQLEKDYGLLKANYESLKLNYSALKHDKEALLAELEDMKSKREEKTIEANASIKEEVTQENQEAENKASYISKSNEESDSSAILDNSSPQHAISPNGSLPKQPMMISPIISSSLSFGCGSSSSTSSANCLEFSEMRAFGVNAHKGYHQFLKMGEHNFLSLAEDDCSFFSEEQAPGFPWYCPEPWN